MSADSEKRRRISFGISISEAFVVRRTMSADLIKDSIAYWSRYSLAVPEASRRRSDTYDPCGHSYKLVLEGGTLWTDDFENYRKMVTAGFFSKGAQTEVLVRIDLPYAWAVSSEERDKASDMITGFRNYLERIPRLMRSGVEGFEHPHAKAEAHRAIPLSVGPRAGVGSDSA